jgi:hypothetical protein
VIRPYLYAALSIIALVTGGYLYAAEDTADTAGGLRVVAEHFSREVKEPSGQVQTRHGLAIYLINDGMEPIQVLTDSLSRSADAVNGIFEVQVGYTGEVRKDGHLLVPSLSKLAPVLLHPGDAAIVDTSKLDLSKYQGGDIRVTYRVLPSWGSRWSVWSGSATAKATAAKR